MSTRIDATERLDSAQPAGASAETCAICESTLVQGTRPDGRTLVLWRRGICRACGDRLDIAVRPDPRDGNTSDLDTL
jgi:hypothetical protein